MAGRQIVNGRKKKPSFIVITDSSGPFTSPPTVTKIAANPTEIAFDPSDAKVVHTLPTRVIVRVKPNKDHDKVHVRTTISGDLTITLTTGTTPTDYPTPVEYVDDVGAC